MILMVSTDWVEIDSPHFGKKLVSIKKKLDLNIWGYDVVLTFEDGSSVVFAGARSLKNS